MCSEGLPSQGRVGNVVFQRQSVLLDEWHEIPRQGTRRTVRGQFTGPNEGHDVTRLYVTDVASQVRWELIAQTLDKRHPLKKIPVENLRKEFGDCPVCRRNCVRWVPVCGINCIRKVKVEMIHAPKLVWHIRSDNTCWNHTLTAGWINFSNITKFFGREENPPKKMFFL
ncbi:hypothetical protein AVEN_102354-1 [Araneus ventricosus]|uniref:Uncharacterized protein n=1 Tax=Araneus ventricosus TaxID=182803 RepID=A0A4Y2U3H4_ARAVE|nr:hypothetical protein AVEN_102354-1 [Araneus ventricosus]